MLLAFEEAEVPILSLRELGVLKTIARGRDNKQIARNLSISEKTGRNHVSNIYKKLHVYDRQGLSSTLYARVLIEDESLGGRYPA